MILERERCPESMDFLLKIAKEIKSMNIACYRLLAIALAGILDQIFGDPRVTWHPICLIGNLISWTENWTRPLFPKTKNGERVAGVYLVIFVLLVATAVPLAITEGFYRLHWIAGVITESILLYFTFAAKSLERESMAVSRALESSGLDAGRKAVSMIVGRDTEELAETGVVKAAVETVAENTSDGVIAPLFYAMLGGAPLAYFYKAVNTMDSMVGYKNDRYRYYGTAAARLDDLVNLIPARLSALLMILAYEFVTIFHKSQVESKGDGEKSVRNKSGLWQGAQKRSFTEVWRIYRRDCHSHASPNSAQTESVMAGALGVRLAGDASYFGIVHHKPTIGDALRPVERTDIARAVMLMKATAMLGWVLALIILAIVAMK